MWKFKKENGKWKSELNPDYVFYKYTTDGIHPEVLFDYLETLSAQSILALKFDSWKQSLIV